MSLSIHSPDELIAAIPHMLGFKLQESIFFIPIRSDLPTARIGLPITPRAKELAWRSIREGMSRYARPGAAVGIVCLTADRQQADLGGHEFAERLDTIGIDTQLLLWAGETRWADLATGDIVRRPTGSVAGRPPGIRNPLSGRLDRRLSITGARWLGWPSSRAPG